MFIVNYLDRVNVGFIQKHLKADLGVDSAAYGFGAGLFFVGYAIFEMPSNILLQRLGARAWLSRIALSWGVVASLMAFVQTETQFYWLRFALGAAEAGFFPGVIYYFTRWLPASERGKTIALFLSGSAIASILSGPLSGALMKLSWFGLKGWQTMLFIEGLFSIAIGVFACFWLDSLPRDAKWLSLEETHALESTLAKEQLEREALRREKPGMLALLRDPQILLFCCVYFVIQLTIYAATFWLPSIIRQMGDLSDLQVGFFNSIPWSISILGMYLAAAGSSRSRRPQAWVAGALLVAAFGIYMSTIGGPIFAFVALCFAALGFKSASSLFWPIPQSYLDARIAAPALALINSLGNLGGFVAPTVFGWLEKNTGSTKGGLYGLAIASILASCVSLRAACKPSAVR
ncbi:MAG: MFS transporter [Verrucomicrobia bacterium]|nr:MFS transporter [Verrucomicrobiota bacterium]MBI3868413.1 MFS transporter [Verrucomicrobiota bacterium]